MERNFLFLFGKKRNLYMPFYKSIKLLFFLFLGVNLASSQNFPRKNYTAANDLPNNAVRSLMIDSKNVLWIGTENGVVKQERDVFSSFLEENGLAQNSCWAIAEDKNQNIWFGSYGEGISIYDGYKFKVISEKNGLVHNEITKLFAQGNFMYVGTSNGVSVVDVNTFENIWAENPPGRELFRVQDFFEYKKQIFVVTYNSGIFKIQFKNNLPALDKVNDHKFNYSIFVDNDSIYSSNKGYFTKSSVPDYLKEKPNPNSGKFGQSIIWDYVQSNDNKIFAAAWGIYDRNGGIYELAGNQMVSKASEFDITSKEVISLAYDKAFEKLYVGTKNEG